LESDFESFAIFTTPSSCGIAVAGGIKIGGLF